MSSSIGMTIPNIWKNKNMFQTTNQKNELDLLKYPNKSLACSKYIPQINTWTGKHMINVYQ